MCILSKFKHLQCGKTIMINRINIEAANSNLQTKLHHLFVRVLRNEVKKGSLVMANCWVLYASLKQELRGFLPIEFDSFAE
jgi:hypothetical protein